MKTERSANKNQHNRLTMTERNKFRLNERRAELESKLPKHARQEIHNQQMLKIGSADLKVAVDCVSLVQSLYKRQLNIARANGDTHCINMTVPKINRLVLWMRDNSEKVIPSKPYKDLPKV